MTRQKLPTRREGETFLLDHRHSPGTAAEQIETMIVSYSRYPDGRIGEVFVNCENRRSERSIGLWADLGIIVSIALQRGATLTELSSAMSRGEINHLGKIVEVAQSPAGTLLDALLDIEVQDMVEGRANG
ncbi:hypothetical protein [Devosia ginsengisoli]|uniref:hypothetical protein n=1 Tax=Devosia ginsengisoli TaxID=400770 RepID=UPI0026EF7BDD|nr:hypothetical protein [Devosia ginsengisoli]MCR6672178.1 hypothetical protein [Devosia ginsengisoli]